MRSLVCLEDVAEVELDEGLASIMQMYADRIEVLEDRYAKRRGIPVTTDVPVKLRAVVTQLQGMARHLNAEARRHS
jgi:hypothetical protein